MTIRVNLLPHRERKRKERREQFFVLMGLLFALGAVLVFAQVFWKNGQIQNQLGVNAMIKAENEKLDAQIVEISKLREEIEALRARQNAVESLQVDRNQPVRVFDELVRQIPEGAYLKAIKQDGKRFTVVGLAQSQERVSEILRNIMNQATWLENPDLIEIKSVPLGGAKDGRKIFEFAMTIGIKDKPVTPATPAEPAATTPPPAGAVTVQPAKT
ncbi:PilN domain-containing protein [Parvibium lacunae]|uniref:Fimbrial assembly protein n=1 Tax=Parvibium lacunae TaxID=1888893 RepID=A0A368L0J1_9BURK|nr:PilN domain-containing protein [Parvibium lacunae]RCS56589.1 fimbrial assembly protein [Parvibium lacunae]